MAADTLDVLTLPEAKVILSVGAVDTTEDANLERLITSISRRLDKLVGPVVRRTVTDERHNGGVCELELRSGPCTSITSVAEYDASGVATTLTEETHTTKPDDAWLGERYQPDPTLYSGVILRRSSGADSFFVPGRNNVLVTYSAGRYADTASVDRRFKEAAALMLKNFWRGYQESTASLGAYEVPQAMFATFAIPNAVIELLHPELQAEIGFGA